jgi:hypothetical protein
VDTIFSGALVPVIPLPQKLFETFGIKTCELAMQIKIQGEISVNQSL